MNKEEAVLLFRLVEILFRTSVYLYKRQNIHTTTFPGGELRLESAYEDVKLE